MEQGQSHVPLDALLYNIPRGGKRPPDTSIHNTGHHFQHSVRHRPSNVINVIRDVRLTDYCYGSCLAVDPILRIAGAISLWSVEIVIQLRIYVLYRCSRKIAIFNAALFFCAILAFVGILTDLAIGRQKAIKSAIRLTLIGCPVVNTPIEWSEWIPATIYEVILFGFALYKYMKAPDLSRLPALKKITVLSRVLVNDNILYFLGVTIVLLLNNLEVSGKTKIPWFSYGPFYASLGIMTTRMLLHLLKSTLQDGDSDMVTADLNWTIDQPHGSIRFRSVSSTA